jgi:hypothetical protein
MSKGPDTSLPIGAHFAGTLKAIAEGGWKQIGVNLVRLFLPYSYHATSPNFYSIYKELVIYLGLLTPAVALALWRRTRPDITNYLWWISAISLLVIVFNVISEMILGILPFTQFLSLRRAAALVFNFHIAILLPLVLHNLNVKSDIPLLKRIRIMLMVFPFLAGAYCLYKLIHFLIHGGVFTDNPGIYFLAFYLISISVWVVYLIVLRERFISKRIFPLLLLGLFFIEMWNFSSHLILISETTSKDLTTLIGIQQYKSQMDENIRVIRYSPGIKDNTVPLHPNTGVILGLYDTQGYNPLNIYAYRRLFKSLNPTTDWNPRYIPSIHKEEKLKNNSLIRILNADLILNPGGTDIPGKKIQVENMGLSWINDLKSEIPEQIPASWVFVFRAAKEIEPETFYGNLEAGMLDIKRVAYVTNGNLKDFETDESAHRRPPIVIDAPYNISHNPGKIKIDCPELPLPGVLLFSENNYPGWAVQVDGEPAEILTIDGTFLGVQLDSGKHRVEFTFNPPNFRIGLIVSVISIVIVVLLSIATSRAVPKAKLIT